MALNKTPLSGQFNCIAVWIQKTAGGDWIEICDLTETAFSCDSDEETIKSSCGEYTSVSPNAGEGTFSFYAPNTANPTIAGAGITEFHLAGANAPATSATVGTYFACEKGERVNRIVLVTNETAIGAAATGPAVGFSSKYDGAGIITGIDCSLEPDGFMEISVTFAETV